MTLKAHSKCPQSTLKVFLEFSQIDQSVPDSQKFVTRSVFELQKRVSTQNASSDNFQKILLNKFYHKMPLTSSFGDRNVNNNC